MAGELRGHIGEGRVELDRMLEAGVQDSSGLRPTKQLGRAGELEVEGRFVRRLREHDALAAILFESFPLESADTAVAGKGGGRTRVRTTHLAR